MIDLARRARVLAPFVVLTLAACDSQDDPGTDPTTTNPTTTAATDATSATTEDTSATEPEDTSATTTPEDTSATTTTDPEDTSTTAPEDTSTTEPDDTSTTEPEDTSTPSDVVQQPTTYSLTMGGWTMNPAEEDTWCTVQRLGNETPILVNRIRTSLSRGSHHLIVYKSGDSEEQLTPFKCTPFAETLGGNTVPVVISQIPEDVVQLPENVGYQFDANQMVRIESHYLNYYPEQITTSMDIHFDTIADGPEVQRSDILFYGNIAIFLLKDEVKTLPWKFLTVPAGLKVFALTGHTHAYGTNVEVEKTTSQSTAGTSVYPPVNIPFEWDEAPVVTYDPELEFAQGDGFRFRCSYDNTSGGVVTFGESAKKEMCFFWAYYYPSQGPIIRF